MVLFAFLVLIDELSNENHTEKSLKASNFHLKIKYLRYRKFPSKHDKNKPIGKLTLDLVFRSHKEKAKITQLSWGICYNLNLQNLNSSDLRFTKFLFKKIQNPKFHISVFQGIVIYGDTIQRFI